MRRVQQQGRDADPDDPFACRHDLASTTRRRYRAAWSSWAAWCRSADVDPTVADGDSIARWLAARAAAGDAPATLAVLRAGVAAAVDGIATTTSERRRIRGAMRRAAPGRGKRRGLRRVQVERMSAVAEQLDDDRMRHTIAVVMMMRDGLLRVSEALALRWSDLDRRPDGSAAAQIARSKTDQDGKGAAAYFSPATVAALDSTRRTHRDEDPIVGLNAGHLRRRIVAAAAAAGIGEVSTHSCRIGMAQDMAEDGMTLSEIMEAGRWRSPAVAAAYTRDEFATRGPVARWHALREDGDQ